MKVYTLEEVAELLRVSPRTILKAITADKIIARRTGHVTIITEDALNSYLYGTPLPDKSKPETADGKQSTQQKLDETNARIELKKAQKQEEELDGWLSAVVDVKSLQESLEAMLSKAEDAKAESEAAIESAKQAEASAEREAEKARKTIQGEARRKASLDQREQSLNDREADIAKKETSLQKAKGQLAKDIVSHSKIVKDFIDGLPIEASHKSVRQIIKDYYTAAHHLVTKETMGTNRFESMSERDQNAFIDKAIDDYNERNKVCLIKALIQKDNTR